MAKRQIARKRQAGHIQRMTDDLKSLREVSQAVGGIHRELGLFKWVMAGLAAVMAAGYWHLSQELGEIAKSSYRSEGFLQAIEKRLGNIETKVGSAAQPTRLQGSLMSNGVTFPNGTTAAKALTAVPAKEGSEVAPVTIWSSDPKYFESIKMAPGAKAQ